MLCFIKSYISLQVKQISLHKKCQVDWFLNLIFLSYFFSEDKACFILKNRGKEYFWNSFFFCVDGAGQRASYNSISTMEINSWPEFVFRLFHKRVDQNFTVFWLLYLWSKQVTKENCCKVQSLPESHFCTPIHNNNKDNLFN